MNKQEAIDTIAKSLQSRHKREISRVVARWEPYVTYVKYRAFADFQRDAEELLDAEIHVNAVSAIMTRLGL